MTPAALSFQIKNLETHLGAPLFVRLNRAVDLTEAGRALLPQASAGFDALRRGWVAARRTQEGAVLNITAGPAFTAKWLAPKLFHFAQAHPDIELRFSASLRIVDFERDAVDLAIRFGVGGDEGYFSEPLYRGWVTPMMRPEIAERVTEAKDLLEENLIHDESLDFLPQAPDWARWFAEAGVETGPVKGPRFTQADHALDMALEGGGVALGRSSIALTALRSGALVAPFRLALTLDAQYRVVCPLGDEDRPAIARFREWIKAEMEPEHALAEARDLVHIG